MTTQRDSFSLTDPVFEGGRYLRAFDSLPSDVDSHQHHILIFLGSYMPFDKGFIDRPVFPSIPTISRATRISESTVRKKLRLLERGGYLKVQTVRLINRQGKWEQSSNNYFFTQQAFDFYAGVLNSRTHIEGIRKRAVGDFSDGHICPIEPYSPPVISQTPAPSSRVTAVLSAPAPNSLLENPKITNDLPSSCIRDLVAVRAEVDSIADAWKEVVGLPVSDDDKMRFLRDYIKTRGTELYFLERIKKITENVYLLARAKSINFLFSGFDMALKNFLDMRQIATRALNSVDTESQLCEVIDQLPTMVANKSKNFAEPSPALINNLFQDLVNSTRRRLYLPERYKLPSNEKELRREIDRILESDVSDETKERLTTIKLTISRMNFARSLELFSKYALRTEILHAIN